MVPPNARAQIEALRARASALRQLARHLDECAVHRLTQRAGTDVWAGPLAQQCLDELSGARRRLNRASDTCRAGAVRLEAQADQLAMLAAAVVVVHR